MMLKACVSSSFLKVFIYTMSLYACYRITAIPGVLIMCCVLDYLDSMIVCILVLSDSIALWFDERRLDVCLMRSTFLIVPTSSGITRFLISYV